MMQHRNQGGAEVSILTPPMKHLCIEEDGCVPVMVGAYL